MTDKIHQCHKCNEEMPAQSVGRCWGVLRTVRENQRFVGQLLNNIVFGRLGTAKGALEDMYKVDRDILLQPGGILTTSQIETLYPQLKALK